MNSFNSATPNPLDRIAFLFPGQGGQHVRVAWDLYNRSPGYAEAFDECLDLFGSAGLPLRRWWKEGDDLQMQAPRAALSLTFAVEYALAQAWRSWGITPDAVLGLSIGEMTAGTIAGTFTLEDAVRAVAIRSQALQDLPPGGMLAVFAARHEVAPLLPEPVWIAVILGPRQLVVAGPTEPLADAAAELAQAGLVCRPVPTTHAAHGPGMAPAVPVFDRALRRLRLAPSTIDFYSACTGQKVSAAEATDPSFWSGQLSQPVVFSDALDTLAQAAPRWLMIEVGPGHTLTKTARRHPTVVAGRHRVLPTLAYQPIEPLAQARAVLDALGQVSAEGHVINWPAVERLLAIAEAPSLDKLAGQGHHRATPATGYLTAAAPSRPTDAQQTARPRPEPGTYLVEDPGLTSTNSAKMRSTIDRLRRLWREILERDDLADDADFFDLGGNSLSAVALMAQVRAEFGVVLEALTLFDYTTLEALAGQIDRMAG